MYDFKEGAILGSDSVLGVVAQVIMELRCSADYIIHVDAELSPHQEYGIWRGTCLYFLNLWDLLGKHIFFS